MFERLGSWTYRFRFLILIAWVVGAVFMAKAAPSLSGQGSTDQTTFLPANSPSARRQGRHRARLPREHVLVVGDHHDGPPRRADGR